MDGYFPEYCVWETTLACSLNCRHCGSSAGNPRVNELDTEESLALIDQLKGIGLRELSLSGGEFILRPDWRLLLSHAREQGLECLVISNGLSITPEVAETFAHEGVGSVSISLDGSPETHNWLRPVRRGRAFVLSDGSLPEREDVPIPSLDGHEQPSSPREQPPGPREQSPGAREQSLGSGEQSPGTREQPSSPREQPSGTLEQSSGPREQAPGACEQPSGTCEQRRPDGSGPPRLEDSHPEQPELPPHLDSYRQILAAFRNLKAARVTAAAITQVSKNNLTELETLWNLLLQEGIGYWQIQLTHPMGRVPRDRGVQREPVRVLDPDDLPVLYRFIRRVQESGTIRCLAADDVGYFAQDEYLLRSTQERGDRFWTGCQAGMRVLGITSNGGVKGCLSMPDPLIEGNVREESLADIWHDPNRFAYNRQFRESDLAGMCAGCEFGRLCRAGCHSRAYTATGHMGENPFCIRWV